MDAVVGHARPDGRNINAGCGSTFPPALQKLVAGNKADLGMAFDGDADRVIFADARGRILEGDHALFLIAALPAPRPSRASTASWSARS